MALKNFKLELKTLIANNRFVEAIDLLKPRLHADSDHYAKMMALLDEYQKVKAEIAEGAGHTFKANATLTHDIHDLIVLIDSLKEHDLVNV